MSSPRHLSVWLEGHDTPIGRLDDQGPRGAARFTYETAYLTGGPVGGRRPLSLMLPLQEEPFGTLETEAFFGNLLQENEYLSKTLITAGIDPSDIVAALGAIGKDCAGAVSFAPLGEPPPKRPGRLDEDYEPFADLEAAVAHLAHGQPVEGQGKDASPLAGVQPKIALTMIEEAFFRPLMGAPTTHILKISPENKPDLADNEAACLTASRAYGLETVRARSMRIGEVRCLLLDRYDRVVENGAVRRQHQEDFAQALGLPPARKYERNGPNQLGRRYASASIARLIDGADRPGPARLWFLRLTLLNLALGNVDNHAKNHAFLYGAGRRPGVAPVYDLVTTRIDARVTKRFAFDIGKAQQFEGLSCNDLIHFAETLGFRGKQRERQLELAVHDLAAALVPDVVDSITEGAPARLRDALQTEWRRNLKMLHELVAC